MSKTIIQLFLLVSLFTGCETKKSNRAEQPSASPDADRKASDLPGVTIEPVEVEESFPDAILEMHTPGEYEKLDPGSVEFTYDVKNFEYARSGNSPFLTVNLNNETITEHSQPVFSLDLNSGAYATLTFLIAPNRVSLKHYGAYVFRRIHIGSSGGEPDEGAPMLFYNQPRGNISSGEDVLLDFYLLNAELAPGGVSVKAAIDGETFIIRNWKAHRIKNLSEGDYTVRLTLIDENENPVKGPFSSVERMFSVQ